MRPQLRIVFGDVLASRLNPRATKRPEAPRLKDSLVALAAYRRDAILEAIAESAQELLRSTDLDASLAKVVARVGQAAGADRLHILLHDNDRHSDDRVARHYIWSAPGIFTPPELAAIGKTMAEIGLGSWARIFASGEAVVGRRGDFDAAARAFMAAGEIKSVLGVPIICNGEWCGIIGFDDCRSEHDWLPAEIDIVKILAELVGAAIASLRRLRVLADASRIIENSPAVVYRMAPQKPFPLVYLSDNIARYGYSAADVLAKPESWLELIEPEDLAVIHKDLEDMAAGIADFHRLEFRFRKPDGSRIWFFGETRPLRGADGHVTALEGILTDISEQKHAEEKLAASHTILTTAIESSPDAILVVNHNDRISTLNRHFVELWDIPKQMIARRDDAPILKLVASRMTDEAGFLARVRDLYAHREARGHDELDLKDGRIVERHSAPLRDDKGQYLGRIWFFRDITDRRRAEQKIAELARSDALTGLPNRVAFLDRVRLAFARAARGDHPFAIHYLDLDRFKDINDTLGHEAGDALLKVVAERLRRCVRDTDVVARFGGDEFAVLQEDVTDVAAAEALATNICRTLAAPLSIDGNQLHTSVSIGIAPFRAEISDPEMMMSKADLALYRAKSEGRNCFRFHIHALDEDVRERLTISEDLHSAVERAELELYYQPQIELASGRIVGLEALIRWNHPRRGLLLPEQFIAIAESSGSILAVGQWVIEEACRQIVAWRQCGLAPPVVAVNISAGQFKLASKVDEVVAAALAKYGIAAEALEVELTESVLMEATQRHRAQFEGLRRLGVRVAIDDFGIGYSSFDYLHSFRVARLKIDRRFVAGVATHPDDATIVRAMIGLAHELGIDVIAEGVETAAQCAFLVAAGCRCGQGYFFGRPMPADAAAALLQGAAAPAD